MAADGQGNIFIADGSYRLVFEVAGWTGNFAPNVPDASPIIGGSYGTNPQNLAVDTSGTIYYWDSFINGNFTGPAYSAPSGRPGPSGPYVINNNAGESQLPLYTLPPLVDPNNLNFVPFYAATGNQTLMTSPNGKLYFVNGAGHGVFVVDRTQGNIPWKAFNPNPPYAGGPPTAVYVYNVGNQNATFTDATRAFTESGNGVGAFTFSVPPPPTTPFSPIPCQPGTTLPPGDYCVINVTNTNPFRSGPIVTDTLHFLTDAVNNNSVSFRINGIGSPAAP
jgi:hypothetical protein